MFLGVPNTSVPAVNTFYGVGSHCIILTWRRLDLTLVVVYKSPKFANGQFIRHLTGVLDSISGDIVIVGDININLKENAGTTIRTLFESRGLQSKLNLTEPSTDGDTHIDCCFSNVNQLQAWFYESYYSYHKPICVVWPK